jgi:hypothetical protein
MPDAWITLRRNRRQRKKFRFCTVLTSSDFISTRFWRGQLGDFAFFLRTLSGFSHTLHFPAIYEGLHLSGPNYYNVVYKNYGLLVYDAVLIGNLLPDFRWSLLPPSSGYSNIFHRRLPWRWRQQDPPKRQYQIPIKTAFCAIRSDLIFGAG